MRHWPGARDVRADRATVRARDGAARCVDGRAATGAASPPRPTSTPSATTTARVRSSRGLGAVPGIRHVELGGHQVACRARRRSGSSSSTPRADPRRSSVQQRVEVAVRPEERRQLVVRQPRPGRGRAQAPVPPSRGRSTATRVWKRTRASTVSSTSRSRNSRTAATSSAALGRSCSVGSGGGASTRRGPVGCAGVEEVEEVPFHLGDPAPERGELDGAHHSLEVRLGLDLADDPPLQGAERLPPGQPGGVHRLAARVDVAGAQAVDVPEPARHAGR